MKTIVDTFRTEKKTIRRKRVVPVQSINLGHALIETPIYFFFIKNLYLILPIRSKNAWRSGLLTEESIV